MKIHTALLQAISLALLAPSCDTGTQKVQQDSVKRLPALHAQKVDSLAIKDSLQRVTLPEPCYTCGMG